MSEQRTEQATPQRKEKARKQGDSVHSRELISSLAMLAGVLALSVAARRFIPAWRDLYMQALRIAFVTSETASDDLVRSLIGVLLPAFASVGMVAAAAFAAALISGVAQSGGIQINPSALQPKFGRLSPIENAKNLFSLRSAARLGKSLLPAAAMAFAGVKTLQNVMEPKAMSFARLPHLFQSAYALMLDAGFVMLAWSALDYVVERRSWSQRLKMSKQDVRDEMKDTQGNPQVKGRLRQIQRTMAKRKRRADVSRASVVITNPTHYAVALEFSFETMQAPVLLAKGKNLIAKEIREEASWAGVPIVENPPLARSIYRSVEPGQAIPYELYATVAGILAFLYRQQMEEKLKREKQAMQRAAQIHRSQSILEGGM